MGARSRALPYDLRWVVLDLGHSPNSERCCCLCHPAHEALVEPCDAHDSRLSTYANEFIYPISEQPSDRPSSALSVASQLSTASSTHPSSGPSRPLLQVTRESKQVLEEMLGQWRKNQQDPNDHFISASFYLTERQLKLLIGAGKTLASVVAITSKIIRAITPLQQVSEDRIQSLVVLLEEWKGKLTPVPPPESRPTPRSQRRAKKRNQTAASGSVSTCEPSPTPLGRQSRENAPLSFPRSPAHTQLCPLHTALTSSQATPRTDLRRAAQPTQSAVNSPPVFAIPTTPQPVPRPSYYRDHLVTPQATPSPRTPLTSQLPAFITYLIRATTQQAHHPTTDSKNIPIPPVAHAIIEPRL